MRDFLMPHEQSYVTLFYRYGNVLTVMRLYFLPCFSVVPRQRKGQDNENSYRVRLRPLDDEGW